jgi:hypothetical protein
MSSPRPPLGEKLAQTIASRAAERARRRKVLSQSAKEALEQFHKGRDEAHEKLLAKLASIDVKAKPEKGSKLFWASRQKRINHELWRTHERLSEMLRLLLKEQKTQNREIAKLVKLVLEQSDDAFLDEDLV